MFNLFAALAALVFAVAAFALWIYALLTEQYEFGFWVAALATLPFAWLAALVLSAANVFLDGLWETIVWNFPRNRRERARVRAKKKEGWLTGEPLVRGEVYRRGIIRCGCCGSRFHFSNSVPPELGCAFCREETRARQSDLRAYAEFDQVGKIP